jgi:hypothetical protein
VHFGENIFATTSLDTPKHVVDLWAQKAQFYDYALNTCQQGEACGLYTQLVWRATTGLGCSARACSKNSPFPNFPNWYLWVCNYTPPGNIVGQKPY